MSDSRSRFQVGDVVATIADTLETDVYIVVEISHSRILLLCNIRTKVERKLPASAVCTTSAEFKAAVIAAFSRHAEFAAIQATCSARLLETLKNREE